MTRIQTSSEMSFLKKNISHQRMIWVTLKVSRSKNRQYRRQKNKKLTSNSLVYLKRKISPKYFEFFCSFRTKEPFIIEGQKSFHKISFWYERSTLTQQSDIVHSVSWGKSISDFALKFLLLEFYNIFSQISLVNG